MDWSSPPRWWTTILISWGWCPSYRTTALFLDLACLSKEIVLLCTNSTQNILCLQKNSHFSHGTVLMGFRRFAIFILRKLSYYRVQVWGWNYFSCFYLGNSNVHHSYEYSGMLRCFLESDSPSSFWSISLFLSCGCFAQNLLCIAVVQSSLFYSTFAPSLVAAVGCY